MSKCVDKMLQRDLFLARLILFQILNGEMAEWPKAPVLKTGGGVTLP